MWHTTRIPPIAFFASLTALVMAGCGGDDSTPSFEEPAVAPPSAPAAADLAPAHGTDTLVSQWTAQRAKIASCPAYKDAPSAVQMARWGWDIVEIEGDDDATLEPDEMESSASPTGSIRFERLRFEAHIVRASSKLEGLRVLRYTSRRTASKEGVDARADAFDRLDGRLGRAPLRAGKRVFAIVFPDPYQPEDLGIAATFDAEDDLLQALPEGSPRGSFTDVSEAIHAERATMLKPSDVDAK